MALDIFLEILVGRSGGVWGVPPEQGMCGSPPLLFGRGSHNNLGPDPVSVDINRKIESTQYKKFQAEHYFLFTSPGITNDHWDFLEISCWQVSLPEPEGLFRQLLIPKNSSELQSLLKNWVLFRDSMCLS